MTEATQTPFTKIMCCSFLINEEANQFGVLEGQHQTPIGSKENFVSQNVYDLVQSLLAKFGHIVLKELPAELLPLMDI